MYHELLLEYILGLQDFLVLPFIVVPFLGDLVVGGKRLFVIKSYQN